MSELKMLDDKEDEKMNEELQKLRDELTEDGFYTPATIQANGTWVVISLDDAKVCYTEDHGRVMAENLCRREGRRVYLAKVIGLASPKETPVSWKEV